MQCACAILSFAACPALQYFSIWSNKRQDFREKNKSEHKICVLIFSTTFVWNCTVLRIMQRVMIKNLFWSSRVPDTGPVVCKRRGRGIALLFHDRGTRKGWVVSNTPRPYFTLGKDPVPIVQEAGWSPGAVWTGGKSRPTRIRSPDRPAYSSIAIPTELPGPVFN